MPIPCRHTKQLTEAPQFCPCRETLFSRAVPVPRHASSPFTPVAAFPPCRAVLSVPPSSNAVLRSSFELPAFRWVPALSSRLRQCVRLGLSPVRDVPAFRLFRSSRPSWSPTTCSRRRAPPAPTTPNAPARTADAGPCAYASRTRSTAPVVGTVPRGRDKVNSTRSPSLCDSTTSPPCARAISRTRLSPSPAPPPSRVRAASTR